MMRRGKIRKRILTCMGDGIHTMRWCAAMVDRGFEVHCAYRLEGFAVPGATLHRLSYPIELRPRRKIARLLGRLRKREAIVGRIHHPEAVASQVQEFEEIIARVRPDIFHVTLRWMWLWANLLDFDPLVVSILGDDLYDDARWDYDRHRAAVTLLRRAALVTADLEHARSVMEGWSCPVDRFHMVPWGVDGALFRPDVAPHGFMEKLNGPVIYCNRNGVPNSCLDVVLRAFAKMRRNRRASLVFGGRLALAETRDELKRLIRSQRIPDVHFMEKVPHEQLSGCYRAADVFVSVPYTDGTSVSVLEAMAMEVPVILSDIPANRELVAAGAAAKLVPVMDVDALFKAMEDVVRRPRSSGRRNRKVALRYDTAVHMDRMAALYRGIRAR